MARHAKISLAMHKPVSGDEPARLRRALAIMSERVADAATIGSDLVQFYKCNI